MILLDDASCLSLVLRIRFDKMDPSAVHYQLKIEQLLGKLLESKCRIADVYLDKLLLHLSPRSESVESALIRLPAFPEWMSRAVALWSSNRTSPSTSVAAFSLNLAGLLSKNEERFCCLNTDNFFIKLVDVCKAREVEVAPSIKSAFVKLLSSFLEHQSGIEWMIACTFWEDVFDLGLNGDTVEIVRESHKFMSKILEKTLDHDENFCNCVVGRIVSSLGEIVHNSIGTCPEAIDGPVTTMTDHSDPRLRLIGDILEHVLEGVLFGEKDLRIPLAFLRSFQRDEAIYNLWIDRNRTLVFDLGKIMFIVQFLDVYVNKEYSIVSVEASIEKIISDFVSHLSRGDFDHFLKFCKFGQLYWNLMSSKVLSSPISNGYRVNSFVNELIVLNLIPNLCFVMKYSNLTFDTLESLLLDDIRNDFFNRLCKSMCQRQHVFRIAYIWRDFLASQPNLFEFATKSLTYVLESRMYYPREAAVLTFQMLLYVLKDFVFVCREFPEKIHSFLDEISYFSLLFEVLAILIEEFAITWKDGVVALDMMAASFDLLSFPNWPSEVVVKALNVIDIAVSKYLSPNLALLLDNTADSTVALLGPLLHSKLYDEVGKVKEMALEVVCTMSRMSSGKFPSLQKVLMDSELPTLVVKMSTCDGESFVRATAIKCLQEMIQVEEIWNNALMSENLSEKMREILLNETEGIVRVEAATFMCIAYEQQQFPRDSLDRIYETMIHSSTTDLHWEVKVRALGFWDKVIKNHLQNQGMIDGTFPNVTFSKEHRKIVTLTDSEIRKRLQKVLNQLSAIGCLGVLVSAIKDDCDMEVSKTAVKITQHLVELFKKYNLYGDRSAPTSPQPTENGLSSSMSVSSGISVDDAMDSPASYHPEFTDEILDQIVNTKDVCLLKHVYSPSDYGSVSNYDIQVRKIVTPNEFLHYTQQDLNNIIQEKKNWLNGIEDLGSLLDDMLKTYDDDVNNMDCY